jgi:hypothetical protein
LGLHTKWNIECGLMNVKDANPPSSRVLQRPYQD